jgi:pimeloyl-[acyl-carrier protein] methyl ester esterase
MRLATETFGQGPELVLVHGWGMNAGVWAPLHEALGARWRVSAIELPGHGESDFDAGRADLDGWVDALLAAAPARALWLGWSLGGQLALAVAARAPERIAGLVLAATNPRFVRSDDWPSAMPAETIQAFAEQLDADAPRTLDRFLALQVRGAEGASDTLRQLRSATRARTAPQAEALQAGLEMLLSNDLRDAAGALAVPSLWLFGGRDALVPASAAEALRGLAPAARVHSIAPAGHAPFLSHPDTCLDLLGHFAEACDD